MRSLPDALYALHKKQDDKRCSHTNQHIPELSAPSQRLPDQRLQHRGIFINLITHFRPSVSRPTHITVSPPGPELVSHIAVSPLRLELVSLITVSPPRSELVSHIIVSPPGPKLVSHITVSPTILELVSLITVSPVSYTHLDVYKRQMYSQ